MSSTRAISDARAELDRWPTDKEVYLTLDLECDYGTALDCGSYAAAKETDVLVDILEKHSVPLSCFLQTAVLDDAPQATRPLERTSVPVEFHAHSHTHPRRNNADVEFEVETSVSRVRERYSSPVVGYRFPDGAAEPADYRTLAKYDVPFNASLFPSWRPGRFNNTDAPMYPYRHTPTGVIELPFTVYSGIRVPVALSYLKVLGRPFEWLVRTDPPDVIVFDLHMHDLVVPPACNRLPLRYRVIYGRQKHAGISILDRFIATIKNKGYSFGVMSELYRSVSNAFGTSP